jgi:hypothetical protein
MILSGIQTWILVISLSTHVAVTIERYGSEGECLRAKRIVLEEGFASRAVCLPGPVERPQ